MAPRLSRAAARRAKEAFAVFLRPMESIRRNPRRALQSPRSAMDHVRRRVEELLDQQLASGGPEAFLARLVDAIPDSMDADLLLSMRKEHEGQRAALEAEPCGRELLALYDAANLRGPISPLLVTLVHPMGDEPIHQVAAWAGFDVARRRRRERKALRLFDAVPDAIEKVYGRYLRCVWALSFLAQGSWPSRPPGRAPGSLGALAPQASDRLCASPGLVDRDAGHIRNAVLHRNARYIPSANQVEFIDAKDPSNPTPVDWTVTLGLDAFEARLGEMLRVAGLLTHQLSQVVVNELFLRSGVVEMWSQLRAALRGDAIAQKELAGHDFDSFFKKELFRLAPSPDADFWFLPRESDPTTWRTSASAAPGR